MVETAKELIQRSNLLISIPYGLLFIASVVIIIHQIRTFKRFNLGILFAIEIAIQSAVRISYFYLGVFLDLWLKVIRLPHGPSYMMFIDLFPELLFYDIYLLLVVTWAVAWLKSKGMKLYKVSQILPLYMLIISFLFIASGALAYAARARSLEYNEVIMWEVLFLVALTALSVLATAIAGHRLYFTLRNKEYIDESYITYMRRLSILIIFTTLSFTLKGAWSYSFSDLIRSKWESGEISSNIYAALRFLYFSLSEVLPEAGGLVFRYLNSKQTKDAASRSRINVRESDQLLRGA